jgi:hypothetical protein
MKNNTFIYELWDLFRIYEDENIFTKLIFRLLNRFTNMRFIYLNEKGFYEAIDQENYKYAELRIRHMIEDGIDSNSSRIVRMNTTLALEKI